MAERRHPARGVVPADWPLVEHSFLTIASGLRWHVQQMGPADAPDIVLVHGTGAATHSWRGLMPILAQTYRVTAMDLPGHGFTRKPATENLSLPAMSRDIGRLLEHLGIEPLAVAGHSAGAAILANMCLAGRIRPELQVSLNGAFRPFAGIKGKTYGRIARSLVLNPVVPYLAAFRFRTSSMVEKMLAQTGSEIDAAGARAYRLAVQRPSHVSSALGMMSRWDLQPLWDRLEEIPGRMLLITGSRDQTISPDVSVDVSRRVPGAILEQIEGLGHLAHEEKPDLIASVMQKAITNE